MNPVRLHLVVVGRNTDTAKATAFNVAGILAQEHFAPGVFDTRVTWIDDASEDGSAKTAADMCNGEIDIATNTHRRGGLANIIQAVADSDDDEVIITWDSDDFFASPHVFERIAREYQDPGCWFTYGGYRCWPDFRIGLPPGGYVQPKPEAEIGPFPFLFRWNEWYCEPPRSFYAGLMKRVPDEYLRTPDGALFDSAWDFALYMSLMDLAGLQHMRYIPDVLYLYNETNPASDFRIRAEKQRQNAEIVRAMKPLVQLPDWR